jgi:ubiquinone/menaquinone biosynthesis C-methylase UbiE
MPLDHFDLLAPFYDKLIRYNNPEKLINLIKLPKRGYILDAGGGTGRVAQSINNSLSKIIVVDISHAMLRQAMQKKGLTSVCSITETLPFVGRSFDRIIMIDAMHHVFDQEKTVLEMWRLLKPGGRIVIEEPNISVFGVKLVAIAEKLTLMRSRFLRAEQIARYFPSQDSQITLEEESYHSWIIVDKLVFNIHSSP